MVGIAGSFPVVRSWHALPVPEVLDALDVPPHRGLSAAEAAQRLAATGANTLPDAARRSRVAILAAQFANVMVGVLFGAAILSGFVGELADTIAIIAILLMNALLGYLQESRAEDEIAALRAMAAPQVRVHRDGVTLRIPAEGVVTGDLIKIEAGDVVAADLRLIASAQLRVAEAALTGESEPVAKDPAVVAEQAVLGDRRSMLYRGTTVVQGRGTGVVVATGPRTELGRIAGMIESVTPSPTPLQRRLAAFTGRLSIVVLAIAAVVLVIGLLQGEALGLMLLTSVSLAVAAIPEALPAVVTVALAFGARRAAARQALVRNLPAVETLGSVTYICTDKTGTLTENHMRMRTLRLADALDVDHPTSSAVPELLGVALAISNDVESARTGWQGDPTEIAFVERALERGWDRRVLAPEWPRVAEVSFTSERARMTTWHRHQDRVIAFMKGAPERVLSCCVPSPARANELDQARDIASQLASQGMRVLVFASREVESVPPASGLAAAEVGFGLLAVVGLQDPPRAGAREAVAECRAAGIRVVMVTGDHPETAEAIARELGIVDGVHARVTPAEKVALVAALQARGECVAMTGDGVNDAPALKRADIGVAMGRGGTDVARQASDLILLDDHFETIVGAVHEGRRIYDNIRKFVRYALTGNSAEIWTLLLAPFLGLPIPLLPIHLLWVNLVTDGLPGIALTVEPGERTLMSRPPRRPAEHMYARGLWQHSLAIGMLMGAATLATQAYALTRGWHWQSMTFTVLAFLQLGYLLAIRSEIDGFYRGFFRNRALLGAVLVTVLLQCAVLYVPVLNRVFGTQPLSVGELSFCFAVSSVGFVAAEVEKAIRRWREPPDIADARGAAARVEIQ